jgi:hypothetical protein
MYEELYILGYIIFLGYVGYYSIYYLNEFKPKDDGKSKKNASVQTCLERKRSNSI